MKIKTIFKNKKIRTLLCSRRNLITVTFHVFNVVVRKYKLPIELLTAYLRINNLLATEDRTTWNYL